MQYRREIDGLRALAVLPVILFHAGFEAFPGGFVGVDVFFVISGYLITRQLALAHQADTFRLGDFWERRARRLLPALLATLLACLPCAWATLTPSEMAGFSASLVAVVLFVSNVFFWHVGNGYFWLAGAQPLLHTWSLAVEEQFYLLFPLVFGLLWRLGGGRGGPARLRLAGGLGVVGGLSLGLSAWAVGAHPMAVFFLLPARAWEFIAGALLPLLGGGAGRRRRWVAPPGVAGAGAAGGLALIAWAVFRFDVFLPYPGWRALVPVCGTVLVLLLAGPGNLVGRGLATPPLVGLGLISYSAYLWHQPLLAFAGWALQDAPLAGWGRVAACGLLLPLAYLSWRFIEQPFRRRRPPSTPSPSPATAPWWESRRGLLAGGVLVGLGLCGVGWFGKVTQGTLRRPAFAARGLPLEARLAANMGLGLDCLDYAREGPDCQTGARPEILLWGDSFAMHLADGIKASSPRASAGMVQFARPVCGPLLGLAPVQPQQAATWSRQCIADNERVVGYLRAHPGVRYVVLGSLFEQYVRPGSRLLTAAGETVRVEGSDTALVRAALQRSLAAIRALGRVPVIFAPSSLSGFNTGRCLVRAGIAGGPWSRCDFTEAGPGEELTAAAQAFLDDFTRQDPVRVVRLADGLCRAGGCPAAIDGTLLYSDGYHLSHEGSRWLGRRMDFYGRITGAVESR